MRKLIDIMRDEYVLVFATIVIFVAFLYCSILKQLARMEKTGRLRDASVNIQLWFAKVDLVIVAAHDLKQYALIWSGVGG